MTGSRAAVVAVDQGTGSTKAVALSDAGSVLARASVPVGVEAPQPGRVEQDPLELLRSVETVLAEIARELEVPIAAVGLSTQRESALAWDTATGEPLSAVLSWQDRRTAAAAAAFGEDDRRLVRRRSGLPLDPMFSALKFAWILDRVDPGRVRARSGRITLGTVDAWLMARLAGERRIEAGNASRTQLLDIETAQWSPELLDRFRVPIQALPEVAASDDADAMLTVGGARVPVAAVLGDSHAALYGHECRAPGTVKATFGTGSSIMGLSSRPFGGGVAETIAWHVAGRPVRAFEGNIISTGATLVWLAELLGSTPGELSALAAQADDGGVDIVPAFAGLAAPWWDGSAVGIISGLTLGTSRAQLARAALESIVLQVEDVIRSAEGSGRIAQLHVDGGPTANDWLMQRQADLSGRRVIRAGDAAMSALGAAWLAGVTVGMLGDAAAAWADSATTFEPAIGAGERAARIERWHAAVARSRLDARGAVDARDGRFGPTGFELVRKGHPE